MLHIVFNFPCNSQNGQSLYNFITKIMTIVYENSITCNIQTYKNVPRHVIPYLFTLQHIIVKTDKVQRSYTFHTIPFIGTDQAIYEYDKRFCDKRETDFLKFQMNAFLLLLSTSLLYHKYHTFHHNFDYLILSYNLIK